MNIKYVWFWPQRQFIQLLVVDDISNDENMNLCKAYKCSGIVQKVAVQNIACIKPWRLGLLKHTDLVFDFDDPRDVKIEFGGILTINPFMFTKSTPLDYFLCKPYSNAVLTVYKATSWYEARLTQEMCEPKNWPQCVFEKNCDKDWRYLLPSTCSPTCFMTDKGMFSLLFAPLLFKQ